MPTRVLCRAPLLLACLTLVRCTFLVDSRLHDRGDGEREADANAGNPGNPDAAIDDAGGTDASATGDAGELTDAGSPSGGDADTPVNEGGLQLCVGRLHACGLGSTGRLSCWGDASEDQLKLSEQLRYKSLTCGDYHTCAIDLAGTLHCEGRNTDGQLAPESGPFVQVTAGDRHTCALAADGKVSCWGFNELQQATPPGAERFRAISAGDSFTCGIRSSDTRAVCWGSNATGRATPPVQERFMAIDAGSDYACGVSEAGKVVCWGAIDRQPPAALPPASSISASAYTTCIRAQSGELRCWNGGRDDTPQGSYRLVAAGYDALCALPAQGPLVCLPEPAFPEPLFRPPSDFPLE
jgi:hypothetical protein